MIPKDLFATFPNTEYFRVSATQNFSQLKPHNLKGATRLITFEILSGNKLKNLEAKVFAEAPNLIYIILESNLITDIHKLAFYGLFNLQEIYLKENQIITIHPKTFSSLESLNVLDLSDNVCVKKRYNGANGKLSEIENDIKSSCDFDFNYQELRKIIDSVENLSKKLITTELKLSSKIDRNATKASTHSNYLLFGMVAITAILTLLGIFLIAFVLKSIQLLKSINSSSYD